MLVLSRKINESIIINNNIKVIIVDIDGDKIRIGIEAPKDIKIHRQEVYDKINKEEFVYKNMDVNNEQLLRF